MSRAQKSAGLTATILLVLLGLWTLRDFIPALIWAAIFAIVIWPLYRRAQTRWPRHAHGHLLPAVFTLLVALVFIMPLAFVVVPVGHDIHDVVVWVNQARRTGVPPPPFLEHLPFGGSRLVPLWRENLSDPAHASALLGRAGRSRLVAMSGHVGTEVLHRLVLFGFTLVTLFFLFRDGDMFVGRLLTASRRAFGPAGESVGRQVIASVHGTLDGLVLVGIGEGVVLAVVYVATGVPRPALFGAGDGAVLDGAVRRGARLLAGGAAAAGDRQDGGCDRGGGGGIGGDVRGGPFHPAGADRWRDAAAVPVGAAGDPGRDREFRAAGAVRGAGGDGGAGAFVAGMGGGRKRGDQSLNPVGRWR